MSAILQAPPATLGIHPHPARAVLQLLGVPNAATIHEDELFETACHAIDHAIDAESPDEAASTRFFLTGRIEELDWHTFGAGVETIGTMGFAS